MRGILRPILRGAIAAALAILVALPFILGDRCARAGGTFDRITLHCARR